MSSGDKFCLVARAVPSAQPSALTDALEKDPADLLADGLKKLSVSYEPNLKKCDLSPADFVQLQNIRSSALARKTNTTSKFSQDNDGLFDDLLLKEPTDKSESVKVNKKKTEKKEKTEKSEVSKQEHKETDKEQTATKPQKNSAQKAKQEKENTPSDEAEGNEDDLLSRGPVKASRPNMNFHPYMSNGYAAVDHNSPLGQGPSDPRWTHYRQQLSSLSTPESAHSDAGYSSSNSPPSHDSASNVDLKGLFAGGADENSELPDALCDFILKYSRRYTSTSGSPTQSLPLHSYSPADLGLKPTSVESAVCDSPMSAGCAPYQSPAGPHGGISGPSTPQSTSSCRMRTQLPSTKYSAHMGKRHGHSDPIHRPAKEMLRNLIQESQPDALDEAWAWTCKCQQYYPGALCYQDADRDTLLHIVTQHLDLPKIYALVEQMLKMEYSSEDKPFDMKNKDGVTPLFLAVEKRSAAVVDYLLEAGADPNTQNSRYERDTPLHHAAGRGMVEVLKTICSYGATDLNKSNGMGLTPLLCAIKYHGVFDEDSKVIIDNCELVHNLLKYGADPMIPDATNGRTCIHYAVDRLAPEMLDVFKNNVEESVLTMLVNQADSNRETPLDSVQYLNNVDESIKQKLGLSLIMCGANSEVQASEEY